MEDESHLLHPFHSDDVHRRAIYLYVNQNFTAYQIEHYFKKEGTFVLRCTISKWIQRYNHHGQVYNVKQQGNKKHKTISDTNVEQIIQLQHDNNEITLDEIQSKLPVLKPFIASISRLLKQHHFTTKQLQIHIEQKNNDLTKATRIEFIENTRLPRF
jgi:transposase